MQHEEDKEDVFKNVQVPISDWSTPLAAPAKHISTAAFSYQNHTIPAAIPVDQLKQRMKNRKFRPAWQKACFREAATMKYMLQHEPNGWKHYQQAWMGCI